MKVVIVQKDHEIPINYYLKKVKVEVIVINRDKRIDLYIIKVEIIKNNFYVEENSLVWETIEDSNY